jgi:hypothetical protein
MRLGVTHVALALLLSGCAHAQDTACKPADNKGECAQEGKTRDSRPERRRAVPAIIPQGPALPPVTVQRPQPAPPPASPAPVIPAPPAPVTSCDAGGCWDGGGTRYNNAAGNVYLNNAGKTCHQIGSTMQCF